MKGLAMWDGSNERAMDSRWVAGNLWREISEALAKVLRKVRLQRKARSLSVQETVQLGEKRFLAIVAWNGKTLLLGVTPHAITLLEPREPAKGSGFAWEEGREA